MFYKTFMCFFVSEAKSLCFSLCSQMFDDVEYTTFKMIVMQMSNYLFVISFQLMFYKTLRYRLARALCIFNCSFDYSLSPGFWQFYFNRGLQRLYTGTCIILRKTIYGFLCLLIVFLKKTYQLILKDVIKLNRNLR